MFWSFLTKCKFYSYYLFAVIRAVNGHPEAQVLAQKIAIPIPNRLYALILIVKS